MEPIDLCVGNVAEVFVSGDGFGHDHRRGSFACTYWSLYHRVKAWRQLIRYLAKDLILRKPSTV
jgi:hypothetical protein